jgi:hypothetical protein
MQIEEIDRHHPSTFVGEDRDPSVADESEPSDASSRKGATGLGLDISGLNLSGSDDVSVSPVGEVPGPRGPGSDRRFSAGNRAFEEQALAVSTTLNQSIHLTYLQALRRVSGDTEAAVPDVSPPTTLSSDQQWVITFLEVSREERIK